MKKLESSLLNMVVVLTLITTIVAVGLGAMEALTHDPIIAAQKAKQEQAIKEVLPEFARLDEVDTVNGLAVYRAFDENEELAGIAIETIEKQGFGGEIKIMVGFTAQGEVKEYSVLSMAETPGLGSKMGEWFKTNADVRGVSVDNTPYIVSKDGGDFDAITAATISSRAFLRALTLAAETFKMAVGAEVDADALTEATPQATTDNAEAVPDTLQAQINIVE